MAAVMPLVTFFSTPKGFTDPHTALIQTNAFKTWKMLAPAVEVILVGNDEGVAETAAEFGFKHIPQVAVNEKNTPLVSSIFALAREHSTAPILTYLNADILTLPDFLDGIDAVHRKFEKFLIVGQRWDIEITEDLDLSPALFESLYQKIKSQGKLHPQGGSDYFIFPRACFTSIPDFAIGRAGWDNWMIYWALHEGYALVNGTGTINIIHQNHDYRHLPNGMPHYKTPETFENVRLAGGRRTILNLKDTRWDIIGDQVRKTPLTWNRFWRRVEVFPQTRLHNMTLANLFFAFFHPRKAYIEFRQWLRNRSAKTR